MGDDGHVRGATARVVGAAAVLALLAVAALAAARALYRAVATTAEGWEPLAPAIALVAERGYLVLAATAVVLAVRCWSRDRTATWRVLCGVLGTVAAYLTSEGVKLLVEQQRPCRVVDVATVLACPPVGDFSWPSNHATLAGGLATACVLALPRTVAFVVPVAVVVAASRVAAGVHYVHDVLSGLALGCVVVTLTVALLRPEARLRVSAPGGRRAWRSSRRHASRSPATGRSPHP